MMGAKVRERTILRIFTTYFFHMIYFHAPVSRQKKFYYLTKRIKANFFCLETGATKFGLFL
jgi:hypothetical protein